MKDTRFESFAETYNQGKSQMVSAEFVADLDTPVSVYLRLAEDAKYSFLLESVEGGAVKGRYSIIGLDPDLLWRCVDTQVSISSDASDIEAFTDIDDAPIDALRDIVAKSKIDEMGDLPPAVSSLVGYIGYGMIGNVEALVFKNADPLELPDTLLMRPTLIAVFDSVRDSLVLTTPVRCKADLSAAEAYEKATAILQAANKKLETATQRTGAIGAQTSRALTALVPDSNTDPEDYKAMVRKAQDYILAGDIFQVVLSQRFSLPFDLPAVDLYRSLRRLNPSPFLFLLNLNGFSVIGSSPEILVRLRDNQITIRPIAGTRPRGRTALEDKNLAEDLLSDPKELAEHLMLLDLGRNDVGRVAKAGSVTVTEKNTVEYYSHVMHIVSNVVGELADGEDAISALFAGFPAGTVSGAPKIRAMEIIEELEKHKRGVYAGAVGYFGADGSMDSCIALRTAVLKDDVLYIQAGAGIVADSDPDAEQRECEAKSGALVAAARDALSRRTP